REQNAGGLESAFWTESGDAQLDINLTQPAGALLEVKIRIESAGGTLTKTIPFTPGQNQGSVTVSNPQPNPEESVKLSVFIGFAGAASEDFNQTDVLNLVFVDDVQGMPDCILCYMEWLLRFFGFNPSFGSLHHVDYGDRPQSAQWAYYTSLFDIHSSDLAMIVATHPIILLDGYEALESWTPALESFNSGGGTAVTQKMTDDLNVVLDRIEAEADGELATLIAHERAALAIDDWPDLTAAEWWDDVVAKRPITSMYLPIVAQQ
ncbi:MAG: hypothetical protein QNJ45_25425, partial [Ardenticatenaceae bacterium]|nr:hypothetical protein [Ardenticatenaceae bacterium]